MAIAVESTFPGMTIDQYDEAIKRMGLTPGGRHPGALFHWVTATGDGVRVVDVWDSKEKWENFAQEQLAPISQQMGMPVPQSRYIDVHAYMTGG